MKEQKLVSVIVINWNGKHFLQDCLDSLRWQTYPNFEIILVDNGSTDGSVEYLREKAEDVKLILLEHNTGFTGGNIAGLAQAKGEYIALINNDTEAVHHWLADLVAALEEDPSAGSCASKLVRFYQPGILDTAGDGVVTSGHGVKGGNGEDAFAPRHMQKKYVFGACAGAALYRRAMLDEVGFLDPDFFLNCEDTDLNFRAQLMGWKCVYVPTAVVRHKVSATVGKLGGRVVYFLSRNDEFVWVKNMPLGLMLRYLHHKIAQELAALVYFGIKKRQLGPFLKGKYDALLALPALLRKRRTIQRKRKVTNKYLKTILIPIFDRRLIKDKLKKLFR